jgi:hypothetical protein
LGIDGELGGQHLDCHVASQAGVLGEIDLTHPARAERFENFVRAQGTTDHRQDARWKAQVLRQDGRNVDERSRIDNDESGTSMTPPARRRGSFAIVCSSGDPSTDPRRLAMQRLPRFLVRALLAVAVAALLVGAPPADATSSASAPVALAAASGGGSAQQAPQLTADMLSGLRPRNIGPALMSGRFVDIEGVERDPYVFYAASATGGVFRTINNGVTWEPVFENEATHSIGDIAVFQPDPDIIWVGTGERANRQSSGWGDGVYKSTDGGETWTNTGLSDSLHIGRIVTHPTDPDTVWVAAMGHLWGPNEERGLYKTSDGGRTWERLLYVDENTGVVDVAVHPSDPDTIWAAAYQRQRKAFGFDGGGPGSALYKSTDGGRTWDNLNGRGALPEGDYGRIGISIYAGDPDIVYVSIEQGFEYSASTTYDIPGGGIYRTMDGGDTWEFRSDWNPRPMYASQPLVDPTNPDRIYMENSFSVSEDGGVSFRRIPQTVHGDDRFLWIDPNDSRHIIKASDGAIAISYDRGDTWLFVETLPVSQFYRINVDMAHLYNVVGGLQDNGSWWGPSATYRSEGILNEDWYRTGGGDGFVSVVDPNNADIVYNASQYLGMQKLDLSSGQVKSIRPGNDQGFIGGRRNWTVWGQDKATPALGNAMDPANWDAPIEMSPHDSSVIYAGTNELWKSTDGGESWTSLGDLTSRVDRAELPIMGQYPSRETLSLDDGVPYYPTLTAIAESPLQVGVLYTGADDGMVQVSLDGGETFTNITGNFPGLPENAWVGGIEPSSFDEATVYAVFDNHRVDDYENHIYKSTDYGQTWVSIVGDMPPRRVARTIREDPRNPNVLYVGAEFGFWISIDGGAHWVELKNNMPTLPFNDFVIHPRDNDLVLGSHGRGAWILDKINAIQELTPAVMAMPGYLFSMETAEQVRRRSTICCPGDNIFYGENPPDGAIIDYWLREADAAPSIRVLDGNGSLVRELGPTTERGINRIVWDLRHERFGPPVPQGGGRGGRGGGGGFGGFGGGGLPGPLVVPGTYTVVMEIGGQTMRQQLEVIEDVRLQVGVGERRAWTRTLLRIGALWEQADEAQRAVEAFDDGLGDDAAADVAAESAELVRMSDELTRRIRSLYNAVDGWVGGPTADQQAQMQYFTRMTDEIRTRLAAIGGD